MFGTRASHVYSEYTSQKVVSAWSVTFQLLTLFKRRKVELSRSRIETAFAPRCSPSRVGSQHSSKLMVYENEVDILIPPLIYNPVSIRGNSIVSPFLPFSYVTTMHPSLPQRLRYGRV